MPLDLFARARLVTISAIASGDDPAMQWRIAVEGEACRFLIFGHLTLGEREFDHASRIEIDAERKRFSFRPDPDWLWGQRYPHAVYHLVSSTPDAIEAIGGDELLYTDGIFRGGAYAAIRTAPTRDFRFAVVGSMTERRCRRRAGGEILGRDVADEELLAPARRFWRTVTRGLRIDGAPALDALFPWLAQNAMIHLTVPHGLEQYTGAAWGTRDVCQGPVEFLLALGTTNRSRRSCDSSSRSNMNRAATGRNGSCSTPTRSSRTGSAMATSSSGR